ncbi:Bbp16 family capsid cement protein [Nonomuraea sp. N2-4H]|uniref:Bbp16 family capsid cement protein n=1 Tax=Nonomuraea sp. N2-4H TaxID=3128898 RepID=UPI003249CB01
MSSSSRPGLGVIRKATLLAALSAALLSPTLAVTPGEAAVTPAVTEVRRQTLAVSIASITPEVPRSLTDVIKITGTVRNDTGAAMSGLQVRLRYSAQRFTDRASLAAYQSSQDNATLPVNVSTRNSFQNLEPLNAGATARWEITATPAQLGLREFGVYPIAVDVAQWSVPISAQRTFLTYAPPTEPRPPRNKLAIALPIIDQPRRATDEDPEAPGKGPLFLDDKLNQALSGRGRLADLLRIAQSVPSSVTWVVDPALLDDLHAMTQGYEVRTKGGKRSQPPSAAASQWLTSMRTSLAASPVVALPYADPDVAALAHQGLDAQTARAIQLGGQKAQQLLSTKAKTNLNWPAGGVLDLDALDLLAVSGVDTVLLDAKNLPPQQAVAITPDAAATLDSVNGPVKALVADPGLSRLFEPAAPTSQALTRQRFIAETAVIATEPGQTKPRSLVIAPSRRWDPNPSLVTSLIKTAGRLPWLQLTTLESLKPAKTSVPRAGLTYTDQDRKQELSGKYLGSVKKSWRMAQLLSSVTTDRAPSAYDSAVLRLTSSAWRDRTRTARGAAKMVSTAVTKTTDKVQIFGVGGPRTLAGSNGVVPISVKNDMGRPIALYIDVKSDNPELLQVSLTQETRTIGSGQSTTFQVTMNATPDTSGDATVTVQLKTADGQPYGKPQRLTIRTTGYTGIALVIVGAALTVMLAAVVTRLLRRRSERKLARAKTRESETV